MKAAERFAMRTEPEPNSGCWLWNGAVDRQGYGRFGCGGRGKSVLAHRWIMGSPENLCVLHKCDNPSCVNPDHLWVGTRAENNRDKAEKGRAFGLYGEENKSAKLSARNVLSIRRRLKCGETGTSLAREFGVSHGCIYRIKHRKDWSWL